VIILFKWASPFPALNSWEIAHVLWYHVSGEITAGIVALHLAGYITPPYRDSVSTSTIYVHDSRPRRTGYGLLGSLTPEPLFVNDPILPLHPTLTPVSVCTKYYLTQMSLTRLMSTYRWCQKVQTFASAQPLPIIR